MLNGSQTRPL